MNRTLSLKVAIIALIMIVNALSSYANDPVQVSGANTIIDGTEYPTLKAAFDAINATANQSGRDIEIKINLSTTETARATLNNKNWNSLVIYPTNTDLRVEGNLTDAIIRLNGARNVTIDGRVNKTGSTPSLAIVNNSPDRGATTVDFLNTAQHNTLQYCKVMGQLSDVSRGIVFLGSSSAGEGNSFNIIQHNEISGISETQRPRHAIASNGTPGRDNMYIEIKNNTIFNFINREAASNGIMMISGSDYFTISGNSFYETENDFEPQGGYAYYAIRTNTNSSHIIENNYIGGNAAEAQGAWIMKGKVDGGNTNAPYSFTAIYAAGKSNETTRVKNNTIRAFNFITGGASTNHDTWDGIYIHAGNVDVIENTIGAPTGTASVYVEATNGATIATSHAILNNSSGVVNIVGNVVGSIEIKGAEDYPHSFEGIYLRGSSGIVSITGNQIGSTTTANSIHVSGAATASTFKQDNYGIYSASQNQTFIKGNTLANLHNAYNGTISASRTRGIRVISGSNEIEDNLIYNISSASNQDAGINSAASVIGIESVANNAGTTQNIRGNRIYNLYANNGTDAAVSAHGIYFSGPSNDTRNIIERNFIHGIGSTSTSNNTLLIGMLLHRGNNTVFNNIISLGATLTNGYRLFSIWDDGGSSNSNFLYFNTLSLVGNATGSTSISTAIWNQNASTKDYRNNIFVNQRLLNSAGSNDLYAIRLASMTNVTIDYNNYWTTGGRIGRVGGTALRVALHQWRIATSQDDNSLEVNPEFQNTSGNWTVPQDYLTGLFVALPGISLAPTVTNDYDQLMRLPVPKMGAFENNNYVWTGTADSNFANPLNWENKTIPPNGANISFATNPSNDCLLDQARTLRNINIANATGSNVFVLNGHKLTFTGVLNFSNGATLDARASGSVLELAGTSAQTLPVGSIVNNEFAALELNNESGFTQNNNYTVAESFTLSKGTYSIGTNTLTLNGSVVQTTGALTGGAASNIVFGGAGAAAILPAVVLNDLTINRADGINMAGDVNVGGTLALTSGTLTLGAYKLTLPGNSPTGTGNIDASNSAAELVFNNSVAITLLPTFFGGNAVNNLSITATGGVTSQGDFTVNGILNLQAANPNATKGSLDMWNDTETDPEIDKRKTLTMGPNATTTGQGDVTGKVNRTTIAANTSYTFGSQFSTITFTGGTGSQLPSDLTFIIKIGTAPPNGIKDDAVLRYYEIIKTGGSAQTRFNLALRYLPAELNGNEPAKMVFWDHHVPYDGPSPHEHGVSFHNTVDNYMLLASHGIGYLVTNEYTGEIPWEESLPQNQSKIWLFANRVSASGPDIFVWIGPQDSGSPNKNDWDYDNNWADNCSPKNAAEGRCANPAVPYENQRIFIQAAPNKPTVNVPANLILRSLYIEQGAEFDAPGTITVDGSLDPDNGYVSWSNQGVFNAGSNGVIFNNANAAIAGNTDFYNISIADGAKLSMIDGTRIGIGNTIDLNATGALNTTFFGNTLVEYSGSAQTVVNPENNEYSTLVLSGNGTKTLPAGLSRIIGDFVIEGNASATGAAGLTMEGDLRLLAMEGEDNPTFNAGAFNHTLKGNFENNGSINASTTKRMTFDGATSQFILGDKPISLQQMVINNPANVFCFNDVVVHEELVLTNGVIATQNDNIITVLEAGTISGGSATSYVSGKLARVFSSIGSKQFPVGKDGSYYPMSLDFTTLSGTVTVTTESFGSGFPGTEPPGVGLVGTRYWHVTQTGGSGFVYDITLDGSHLVFSNDPLILKHSEPVTTTHPAIAATSSYTASGLTSFSDFTLGETTCEPPAITAQPSTASQTLCLNGAATDLVVTATGDGLIYQWYENTVDAASGGVPVGTNANIHTPSTSEPGTYYYYVVITGECGTATSAVSGVLQVNPLLQYRSMADLDYTNPRDWTDKTNWEQFNGTTWVVATSYPGEITNDCPSPQVTILGGHSMEIQPGSNISIPNLKVEGTGKLTIRSGGKIFVQDQLQLDQNAVGAIVVE